MALALWTWSLPTGTIVQVEAPHDLAEESLWYAAACSVPPIEPMRGVRRLAHCAPLLPDQYRAAAFRKAFEAEVCPLRNGA